MGMALRSRPEDIDIAPDHEAAFPVAADEVLSLDIQQPPRDIRGEDGPCDRRMPVLIDESHAVPEFCGNHISRTREIDADADYRLIEPSELHVHDPLGEDPDNLPAIDIDVIDPFDGGLTPGKLLDALRYGEVPGFPRT